MLGRQAKILSEEDIEDLLAFTGRTRYPARNRIIVLLSIKAGLRAGEIAQLTWDMVLDRQRSLQPSLIGLELHQNITEAQKSALT
jgi:integrase